MEEDDKNYEPTVWLTRKEAAVKLLKSVQTLANWHSMGFGPKAYRPSGGPTLYKLSDVEEWNARTNRSAA